VPGPERVHCKFAETGQLKLSAHKAVHIQNLLQTESGEEKEKEMSFVEL
jgi:hypothetical protein